MTNANNNATSTICPTDKHFLFLSSNLNSIQKPKKLSHFLVLQIFLVTSNISMKIHFEFIALESNSVIGQIKIALNKIISIRIPFIFLVERRVFWLFLFSSFYLSSLVVRVDECHYVQCIWREEKMKSIKKCHRIGGNGVCSGNSKARVLYILFCSLSVCFIHMCDIRSMWQHQRIRPFGRRLFFYTLYTFI